jgi:hypothetical protein
MQDPNGISLVGEKIGKYKFPERMEGFQIRCDRCAVQGVPEVHNQNGEDKYQARGIGRD